MRILSRSLTEHISLAEAQYQCKVDTAGSPLTSDHDSALTGLIATARGQVERYLGRALTPTTVLGALDEFPEGNFALEGGPVIAIQSIYYTDEDGVEQRLDDNLFTLNTDEILARVVLDDGEVWPATQDIVSAVRVTYVIGNTLSGESPDYAPLDPEIKQAMLLLIKFYFDGGEPPPQWYTSAKPGDVYMPPAAKALLGPHILRRRFA